jgi:hypothetical protein
MADERTEKQKVKEITDRLEQGLKELFGKVIVPIAVATFIVK